MYNCHMKRLLIIPFLIVLVGCAPLTPVTQNFTDWTLTQNQRHAYTYEENLTGSSQDEILTKFGPPDEKSVREDLLAEKEEIWLYRSALGYNRKIRVIFINGIVDAINYN